MLTRDDVTTAERAPGAPAPAGAPELALGLSPRRVVAVLAGVAVVLFALSLADGLLIGPLRDQRVKLLDVDLELSLPTFLQTVNLLLATALWALVGLALRRDGDRSGRTWLAVAALFVVVAFDEASGAHDIVSDTLRARFDTGGVLFYAWVLPGAVVALGLAALLLRPVLALPGRIRRGLLLAAALFLAGALGVELLGSREADAAGRDGAVYVLLTHLEEALEVAGQLVLVGTLLIWLGSLVGTIRLAPERGHAGR